MVTWSKAGPSMQSLWTSEEIVSGIEAVGEHGARGLERERALAMADVEQHAALARLPHRPFHRALRGHRRVGKRPEGVRQHVAGTQPRHHLLIARRRMIDVAHQGHADLLGHLERDFERHDPGGAGGVQADPHLDADDEVAVGVRDFGRADRIHQPQLLALADHDAVGEAKDAGMRDMQIGEDAHLARLDHMLAEAREIAGAGAAGVDAVVTPEVRQNSSASMPSEVPPQ